MDRDQVLLVQLGPPAPGRGGRDGGTQLASIGARQQLAKDWHGVADQLLVPHQLHAVAQLDRSLGEEYPVSRTSPRVALDPLDSQQLIAEARLRAWLPEAVRAEYALEPLVRHGNAAEEVILLARETGADLIVVGAQHQRFVDTTVLGVTTERVTRHALCPVLVVPGEARK